MADTIVNEDVRNGKKPAAFNTGMGAETVTMRQIVTIASGDADDDIFRVFTDVSSAYVPVSITVSNSAITGGTDYDLGLYGTNGGGVIDVDVLADGVSFAGARAYSDVNNLGLENIALADTNKDLYELSGQAIRERDSAYDIALTANTVGSADGTIVVTATFAYK